MRLVFFRVANRLRKGRFMNPTRLIAAAAAMLMTLASNAALADEPRFVQVVDMRVFGDAETTLPGAGNLRRNPHGVDVSLHMTEQLGSISGGCDVFACTDEQAVAFLPLQVGGAEAQ